MERKILSHGAMALIAQQLKAGEYELQTATTFDDEHQKNITVEDNGDGVEVSAYYKEDTCKGGLGSPEMIYTYQLPEYTIVVEQGEDSMEFRLKSNEYNLDPNDSAYAEIEDFFDENIDYMNELKIWEQVAWAEWTEDELYAEILPGLCYDEYICVDGKYIGDIDTYLENLEDGDEQPDNTHYTTEEVARALAEEGCPDAW